MWEITGDNIAQLSDEELRTLVGMLCEAEVVRAGLDASVVTWGGNQDAKDGGIDVRVELPKGTNTAGFIPRRTAGFQCKCSDMPASKIADEMRPRGKLRPAIRGLAGAAGAYIIVSSKGSATDTGLSARKLAMHRAKGTSAKKLHTDFYDRGRLASWVRSHPAAQVWALSRIGKVFRGWQTYSAWDAPNDSIGSKYLLDERVRLFEDSGSTSAELSVIAGMSRIRAILEKERGTVRLVGLSGVGKTRLARALFDARAGQIALAPSLAVYTDMGQAPVPQPLEVVHQLVSLRQRAIVVVDNCPPELHRQLTDVCVAANSKISLITIEYDIRDDQPEHTNVFRLEPSSDELIEAILKVRFPKISLIDVSTIARISGGNARLALALAKTVRVGESLKGLRDAELFERLFRQRYEENDVLLQCAQVCSLLYSFQGEALEGDQAELPILAQLIGIQPQVLFRNIAVLRRRTLVQARGVWRAVLPHALANYLASRALEEIPNSKLKDLLVRSPHERLVKSFSRRLGYLDSSAAARELVGSWLLPEGLLGNIAHFDDTRNAIFRNVAAIKPEKTLSVLESEIRGPNGSFFVSVENHRRMGFVHILRSLAYEPAKFERAIDCLVCFAKAEPADYRHDNASDVLKSLFGLYLSGTHASPEQRIQVVQRLLESTNQTEQRLGLLTLRSMLKAWQFSSSYNFDFGMQSRDHGWFPRSHDECQHWFRLAIGLAMEVMKCAPSQAEKLREIIADKFRALWVRAGMMDELEHAVAEISRHGFWVEGWLAVARTLSLDKATLKGAHLKRLQVLASALRPNGILERAQSVVLSRTGAHLDLADTEAIGEKDPSAAYSRLTREAVELGKAISNDADKLKAILPDVVRGDQGRKFEFGRGLAAGAERPEAVWRDLSDEFRKLKKSEQRVSCLCGFLSGLRERNSDLCDQLLDMTLEDSSLCESFPYLQASSGVDLIGASRLEKYIADARGPIFALNALAGGRAIDALPTKTLRNLLDSISAKPDGANVAIDILHMRLFSGLGDKPVADQELTLAAKSLMTRWMPRNSRDGMDYELSHIVEKCFTTAQGAEAARLLCRKLNDAHILYDYEHLVGAIFKVQPKVALDFFFGKTVNRRSLRDSFGIDIHQKNPLDYLVSSALFDWCDKDGRARYPRIAAAATIIEHIDDPRSICWSAIARELMSRAPQPEKVLEGFLQQFQPMSWSGSRADILERRSTLLNEFVSHPNVSVSRVAVRALEELRRAIVREREWERHSHSERDERFE